MANNATHIVKVWVTGDYFLASDIENIVKGTVNQIIDDNDAHHPLELTQDGGAAFIDANNTSSDNSIVGGQDNEGHNKSLVFGVDNKGVTTSLVGGGYYSDGSSSTVSGNEMIGSNYSMLLLGAGNRCQNSNTGLNIGLFNRIEGEASGVIGKNSILEGNYSFSVGYITNLQGNGSYILQNGGSHNAAQIDGNYSGLFAGFSSYIDGDYNIILGGQENELHGTNSAMINASNNDISKNNVTIINANNLTNSDVNDDETVIGKTVKLPEIQEDSTEEHVLGIDSTNKILSYHRRNWYGYEFFAEQDMSFSETTSTSFQDKILLSIPIGSETGHYIIEATGMMYGSSTSYDVFARLQIDSNNIITYRQEPKEGGNDNHMSFTLRYLYHLTDNTIEHKIALQYRSENTSATAAIGNTLMTATLAKK